MPIFVANNPIYDYPSHTIDFDLFVPPFDSVKKVTLMQKIIEAGNAALKMGKRLGFSYGEESDV